MQDLSGKVALVTGASQGIGKAIARSLQRAGVRLIALGRSKERLEKALGDLPRGAEDQPTILQADLSDLNQVTDAVGRLSAKFDSLDILINCGGIYARGTWEDSATDQFDLLFKTNVAGVFALTQALLPLLARAEGDVVFVNSSIVHSPGAGTGHFKATQHALQALADSLRAEINGKGVRVLTVYPGRTATPRQKDIFALEDRDYDPGQLLQADDIAEILLSCLSLSETAEVTELRIRPRLGGPRAGKSK